MKVCDEGLVWRGQLFKREEKFEENHLPQSLVTGRFYTDSNCLFDSFQDEVIVFLHPVATGIQEKNRR
jgi:hypothetical protein